MEYDFNFLSIDFDYFINCTAEQRDRLFPDADSHISSSVEEASTKLWKDFYRDDNNAKMGVVDDYFVLLAYLQRITNTQIFVSESHADLYVLLESNLMGETAFKVHNVDFHHDMYCGGSDLDCSNWGRLMEDNYPNSKLVWCRRDDSQTTVFGGEVAIKSFTGLSNLLDTIEPAYFDGIFLCKSSLWSPPHLDPLFYALVSGLDPSNQVEHMTSKVYRKPL